MAYDSKNDQFGETALNLRTFSVLVLAAGVLALPMMLHGPLPQGHDTHEHLNYTRHFSAQFWKGEWYPRWLLDMNHGLGSPSFFVYPPLPSYVCALLAPIGVVFDCDPFKMGEFLVLLGSGACAFLWLTSFAVRRIALLGAVLYMFLPYHLAVDYYRRTALSECWAMVWMPLVLFFTTKVIERKSWSLMGLAISYCLLVLSHPVSAAIFSPVPVAFAAMFSPRREAWGSTVCILAGMLLGAGLASFYLVPALAYAKYFPVSRLPLWSSISSNFLTLGKLLHPSPAGNFVRSIAFMSLDMVVLCLVCAGVILADRGREFKKFAYFWIAVALAAMLLMSGFSSRLWEHTPALLGAIQYPWRLNILLCLASVAIVTAFLSRSSYPRSTQYVTVVIIVLAILPWFGAYGNIWQRYRTETAPQSPIVSDDDGWFPAWSAPGLDQTAALNASRGPKARFLAGEGSVDVLVWNPRHIEIQTSSETGGRVMINQFYFPLWEAHLAADQRLAVSGAMPEGLLQIDVSPGLQRIRLDIPQGRAEKLGGWVSLCALFAVIVTSVFKRSSIRALVPARAAEVRELQQKSA